MHYIEPVIRPPSEADSILLQVTTGCSHNRCAFCGVYKSKRFRFVDEGIVAADIAEAAVRCRGRDRVFLCDGDALILPQARLLRILSLVRERLPWVTRVGTYANAKSIARKCDAELRELREHNLRIIHLGLESGDDETLVSVGKYGTAAYIVEQGRRALAADIRLFVTVILGLGGTARSAEHARLTGEALSAMNPEYVGALSLMLLPGTPLYERRERGEFAVPDATGMLRELRTMIACTDLRPGYFYANHASNYLPLRARLPRDKERTLATIDAALAGAIPLTPEWMRGL